MATGQRRLRRIGTHNVRVGRGWRAVARGLREFIAAHDPDVIALQEARNYVLALRIAFATRWRIYAPPTTAGPEARDCPVMVRRDLPRARRRRRGGWGWVQNRIGWRGPKHGWLHPGRTWTWVTVDGVAILSLHRVWTPPRPTRGRGPNAPAYAEEAAALREWLDKHRRAVVIGDANGSTTDPHPASMRATARATGAQLVDDHDDPGIDYAAVKGLDGKLRRLRRFGSTPDVPGDREPDHRAALLTIRRRGDTLREQMS